MRRYTTGEYLPLSGGTLTGNLTIGANKLRTTSLYMHEEDIYTIACKYISDNTLCGFHVASAILNAYLQFNNDASYIASPNTDSRYSTLKSRDSTVGLVEVARLAGAATAYFNTLFGRLRQNAKLATLPIYVRKAADETLPDAVLQNDDELLLALAANEVWLLITTLLIDQTDAARDWQFGWAYPVGCDIKWNMLTNFIAQATALEETDVLNVANALTTTTPLILIAIVANGANAGNVNLQEAKLNAPGAGTNTVRANSSLLAFRLA